MRGPAVGVGAVVLDEDGRLLVILRGNPPAAGRWTFPGGRVEAGESLEGALVREMAEETGLRIEVGDLVGFTESVGEHHHYIILDFHAEIVGGELEAGDDAADVAWMTRTELEQAGTTDGLIAFLDEHQIAIAP
jgi:8-oxo-dGTP diphosphatase